MQKHLEIEFKTLISKEKYEELLKKFNLEDKIFKQTNYYFDDDSFSLLKNKTVLRIRQKEQYKLTKKEKGENGNNETSLYLTDEEAIKMIRDGFDASIIGINSFVKTQYHLTTFRAKIPYLGGTLFLDKSEYSGIEDFEIELEVTNYDEGIKIFEDFIKDNDIELKKSISKSERANKAFLESKQPQ